MAAYRGAGSRQLAHRTEAAVFFQTFRFLTDSSARGGLMLIAWGSTRSASSVRTSNRRIPRLHRRGRLYGCRSFSTASGAASASGTSRNVSSRYPVQLLGACWSASVGWVDHDHLQARPAAAATRALAATGKGLHQLHLQSAYARSSSTDTTWTIRQGGADRPIAIVLASSFSSDRVADLAEAFPLGRRWLWRTLTYWKLQPLRRTSAPPVAVPGVT